MNFATPTPTRPELYAEPARFEKAAPAPTPAVERDRMDSLFLDESPQRPDDLTRMSLTAALSKRAASRSSSDPASGPFGFGLNCPGPFPKIE